MLGCNGCKILCVDVKRRASLSMGNEQRSPAEGSAKASVCWLVVAEREHMLSQTQEGEKTITEIIEDSLEARKNMKRSW